MTETQQQPDTDPRTDADSYQALVRQVADQVWRLWQAELRTERERRGNTRRQS